MSRVARAVDLFAGAGGTSTGLAWACRELGLELELVAINHCPVAISSHRSNYPQHEHICWDIDGVDPLAVVPAGKLDLLLASPECTYFSTARGGRSCSEQARARAHDVVHWLAALDVAHVLIENVKEFRHWGPLIQKRNRQGEPVWLANGEPHMVPDPARKGEYFCEFVADIERLGYQVEHRILCAADYGAATTRTRFFLQARKDGRPIVWPRKTRAPRARAVKAGLPAWRPAAEIIDWTLPCQSIFLTAEQGKTAGVKRPLAEKTLKRIAEGIVKFVIEAQEPFIVGQHFEREARSVAEPLRTVTCTSSGMGLVVPYVQSIAHGSSRAQRAVSEPLGTIVTKQESALVAAHCVAVNHGESAFRGQSLEDPLRTVTTKRSSALVSAFLMRYFGTSIGCTVREPHPTVCTSPAHSAVVAAFMTKYHGGAARNHELGEPLRTIDTANRFGLVTAFLLKYYGRAIGQHLVAPLDTVTCKGRFGLVCVEIAGEPYAIVDIGLRMLTPDELAKAQGFPAGYAFEGSKEQQTRQIGNAVEVYQARALCRAILEGVA